ncbi:MAG TPA: ScpA family protein [Candidatus Paceibacterota bacterium]|nr:ScpA family protein [Candidatus Paceibacterota bacterium]
MTPTVSSIFSVKTEVFEGPLELLLDLVERRKLLINDISLAAVTDEYMKQVIEMQELSLPNTAQFISLAATLLLVKSKSLLPVLELTEEEETSIEDLEERLRYYQIIRDAALPLQVLFGQKRLYPPQFTPAPAPVFVPDTFCSLENLREAIFNVLNDLPKKELPAKAKIKVVISLEEMMERLEKRIRDSLQVRFSELHVGETERKVVIVGFLALLELFKQGNLLLKQEGKYADIEIELEKGQTPSYL